MKSFRLEGASPEGYIFPDTKKEVSMKSFRLEGASPEGYIFPDTKQRRCP